MNGKQVCCTNFQVKKRRNCNTYKVVKLLQQAIKIVKRVLKKRIRKLVNTDSMQFGFMSGGGTADALFVV